MNIQPRVYDFIEDSGHGWVKVPKPLLMDLEIYKDISSFSYEKDNYVYLEEDCDYSLFHHAMKRFELEYTTTSVYIDGYCYVRNLGRVQNGKVSPYMYRSA